MTTFNNIFFVGGIHGVGKSLLCQSICRDLNIEYLSASTLLKWSEINKDPNNKNVKNIADTQTRLILGLEKVIKKNIYYLLDGHYCLLDSENKVKRVPFDTFIKINPRQLFLIFDDIVEIKKRLEVRDNKLYNLALLESLQQEELEYAKFISENLKIDLIIGSKNNYSVIIDSLHLQISPLIDD